MLKKTITFEDLDGNPVTEDFYFNLSKAEVAEMEFSEKGGLSEYLKRIVAEEDSGKLMETFKDIIKRSVGQRSEDGRRFIKNQDIVDNFIQTDAYSELFMELATQADAAVNFITNVIPRSLDVDLQKTGLTGTEGGPSVETLSLPASETTEPAWLREGRTPTPAEVRDATPEQLRLAFSRKQADQVTP